MYSESNKMTIPPFHMPATSTLFTSKTLASFSNTSFTTSNISTLSHAKRVCIPQLVELQASVLPEKTALVMGNQTLSYSELNSRANQLAHYLQQNGIGPEVLVGVCMDRSLDFIVALLGILKAGGAYVPLDPACPTERLAFILADSQIPVVLTQKHLLEHLPITDAHVVCIDSNPSLFQTYSSKNPVPATSLNNLVYVIYTSGSMRQPKGVEVTHSALLNLVNWHHRSFTVSADSRATQVASPAFDAAGWEIWPYLSIGSTLYLPDEETRITPHLLRDWLITNEITHSFLPTLLAESLMTLQWPAHISLRYLLTNADTLHQHPDASLPFALVNNYGPTESSIMTTSGIIPTLLHSQYLS